MNILTPGKGIVISVCIILLQMSVGWVQPVRSLSTGVDSRNLSSRKLSNSQRINRSNPSSMKLYSENQTGTDFIFPTSESLMPTIVAIPVLKTETVGDSQLPENKVEPTSSTKNGFQKAEQSVSPLNIDISGLPNSDSVEIETPSFIKTTVGVETDSDQINSTHVLEDPSTDPRVEPEPFLTILVNSPPRILADAPQLQSSSAAPPKSVDIPNSYPLVRAPMAPSPYPITITPLPVRPLEAAIPSSEKVVISPSPEAINPPVLTSANLQMPANLTIFPLSPAKPVKTELNSYAGHGALYQALPPFYGIIYPVLHSVLPYPFGQQIELEKAKNKPATSYGLSQSTYVQHENDNYQRQFGHPPTARALGFPPISNTHDNLRREVNWYRVGRSYRSAD